MLNQIFAFFCLFASANAFLVSQNKQGGSKVTFLSGRSFSSPSQSSTTKLFAEGEGGEKAAKLVSGEELELLLTEWDKPLVVDAYAQWCGPCLLMATEYEAAAQELQDRVRFVKLDTDKDESMAARLNIMGLPTLLFLDQYVHKEGEGEESNAEAKAVLKGRVEGAMKKQTIVELCEHYFFGAPAPQLR